MYAEFLKEKEDWDCRTKTIATIAVVGGSAAGKSTLIAKLAKQEYQSGLMTLTGDGNTTSYPTTIEFSSQCQSASILLPKFKSREEIIDDVKRHLKSALFPELKNCISSGPSDEMARKQFLQNAMEKRMPPSEQAFRLHKLLGTEVGGVYHQYLTRVLQVADQAADQAFHANYFNQLKDDKAKANQMLEDLIVHLLDDTFDGEGYSANDMVMELVDMITSQAKDCLEASGFNFDMDANECIQSAWALKKEPDDFLRCLQAITNNRKGEHRSAACIISEANILVKGDCTGIPYDNGSNAYRILDVIGFDNDGFNITERVSEALLSSVAYDIVLYTTSIKYTPAQNKEYLTALQSTIRPCQLIGALTHFDSHEVFSRDDDEDATLEQIEDAVTKAKRELLEQMRTIVGPDCRAKLPTGLSDVICFANSKGLKRLGNDAVYFFGNESKTIIPLRMSFGLAYKNIRYKIKEQNVIEVSDRRNFIGPNRCLDELIHSLRQKLEASVISEFAGIRDRSSGIHHWTLDAIFWHLARGQEHVSQALVWQNVRITTYTQFAQVCFEAITPAKFVSGVNIPQSSDRERIIREFESNLRAGLSKAAVIFFLKNREFQDSECKAELRSLALKPKYNKWGIMHDLLDVLLKQLSDEPWLKECVQNALYTAAEDTYSRLLL